MNNRSHFYNSLNYNFLVYAKAEYFMGYIVCGIPIRRNLCLFTISISMSNDSLNSHTKELLFYGIYVIR